MNLKDKKLLKAAITAVGGYVPDTILSNKDLEKMVERIDEISRKIAAKATQVSLALKSSS